MIPCKVCSVKKARQLAINKDVGNNKKATRADKRMFLYLVTNKAPQDSGVTITNRNWYIVMVWYTGDKELEFHCTNSDFVEPMCKTFSE